MAEQIHDNPSADVATAPVNSQSLYEGDVNQITITNGAESRTWLVHKNVLKIKSPYFAALPNFQEGAENKVNLQDINFSAFGNLVTWLYQGQLDPNFTRDLKVLIHTWAVADHLMMVKCKNLAMDALRATCVLLAPSPEYLALTEKLGYASDSLLAQFLMDQIAYECVHEMYDDEIMMEKEYTEAVEDMQTKMTLALMLKIIKKAQFYRNTISDRSVEIVDPSRLKGCHYHEHANGEKCYLETKE